MEDGSIRIEEATEEALGTYTCVPYNTLGTMGQSAPARLVLKVRPRIAGSLRAGGCPKCPPSQPCGALSRTPHILRCYRAGSTGRRPAGSYSSPVRPQGTPSLSSSGERYLWVLELWETWWREEPSSEPVLMVQVLRSQGDAPVSSLEEGRRGVWAECSGADLCVPFSGP